jgi:thiol-disulfide isomerase/thioredoxin
MKIFFTFLLTLLLASCSKNKTLELGTYRASLTVQDNQQLPFIMNVINDSLIEIYNAEEKIIVDEISYSNDSVKIQTPVFEGYIIAKISSNELTGSFIKESYDRIVSFKAVKNSNRFDQKRKALHNISGNWETVFSENATTDRYVAKGVFTQKGNSVTGTFRTTTGDYRYLEGVVDEDSLKLSTFDGAHAFLFLAKITNSTMVGEFYSGLHWKEPFEAKLNNTYELPSADNLTSLKDGYNKLSFSFPDKNGKLFSLSDKRFKNKVTIVQIMGTWCPNCLDESKYLSEYNQKNKDIEVIALAFEVAKTKEIAFKRINRLQDRIGINYPIVLAHFGSENKIEAHKKLPMLNHIISFPTTVVIDKKGNVRKIHTGFNGPATGQNFLDFKKNFETFIDDLRKE